jgi:predicted RNase H-like nuclease (RuvC/YqgF family)
MENNYFDCKKVKYASEEYALFDVSRIKKKSNRDIVPFRVYLCHCGSWHLTSKLDKREAEINELKIKNIELQKELDEIKSEFQNRLDEIIKNQNKEDRILIKTDARILELQKGLQTSQIKTKELREINIQLICELIQLKKKYEQ